MPWFVLFMFRLASGERFRKATEAERRCFAASFLFVPITLGLFMYVVLCFMDKAHAVANWSFVTAGFTGTFLGVTQWPKYFSARASLMLGAIVWAVTLWFAL
jgi:hypothetical protein